MRSHNTWYNTSMPPNQFSWRRVLATLWAALFALSVLFVSVGELVMEHRGPIGTLDLYFAALPVAFLLGAISGFRRPFSTSWEIFIPIGLLLMFPFLQFLPTYL